MALEVPIPLELIFPAVPGSNAATVLSALSQQIVRQSSITDGEALFDKLWQREKISSTGIGHKVAIPHCKMKRLRRVVLSVGVSRERIEFGAIDGQDVGLLFVVVSPSSMPAEHLRYLAAIARWVKVSGHVEQLLGLQTQEEIHHLLTTPESA